MNEILLFLLIFLRIKEKINNIQGNTNNYNFNIFFFELIDNNSIDRCSSGMDILINLEKQKEKKKIIKDRIK